MWNKSQAESSITQKLCCFKLAALTSLIEKRVCADFSTDLNDGWKSCIYPRTSPEDN